MPSASNSTIQMSCDKKTGRFELRYNEKPYVTELSPMLYYDGQWLAEITGEVVFNTVRKEIGPGYEGNPSLSGEHERITKVFAVKASGAPSRRRVPGFELRVLLRRCRWCRGSIRQDRWLRRHRRSGECEPLPVLPRIGQERTSSGGGRNRRGLFHLPLELVPGLRGFSRSARERQGTDHLSPCTAGARGERTPGLCRVRAGKQVRAANPDPVLQHLGIAPGLEIRVRDAYG
jgi:hypothetical protein